MIVIAGRMKFAPDKLADALDVIRPLVGKTRAEPGNVNYCYYADLDDPATLFIFEEWQSDAALEGHFQMPYMIDFVRRLPTLGIVDASVHRYEVTAKSLMG